MKFFLTVLYFLLYYAHILHHFYNIILENNTIEKSTNFTF